MQIANPSKALILLVALLSVTILMIVGRVTAEAGLPIITAFGGYGLGNGIGTKGSPSPKMFLAKEPTE